MKKVFTMAFLNYKNYKKLSKPVSIVITLCSILFLIFATLSSGFNKLLSNYNINDPSLHEIEIYKEDSYITREELSKVSKLNHVEDVSQTIQAIIGDLFYFNVDDKRITCEGLQNFKNTKYSTFSKREVLEKNNNSYVNPIVFGKDFNASSKKQALIDENFAYILGFDMKGDIVGKKITVEIGTYLIEDVEIIGVFSYSYGYEDYRFADMTQDQKNLALKGVTNSPFILSQDLYDFFEQSERIVDFSICNPLLFCDLASNVKEVCDNINQYYELKTISLVDSIEKRANIINAVKTLIYIIAAVIAIIAVLSIISTMVQKILKQAHFTDLMLKIGYKNVEILWIYILENFYLLMKTILFSFGISFIISLGIDIFMANGYKQITTYKRFLFLLNFPAAVVYYLAVLFVVVFISLVSVKIQIRRKHIHDYKK